MWKSSRVERRAEQQAGFGPKVGDESFNTFKQGNMINNIVLSFVMKALSTKTD